MAEQKKYWWIKLKDTFMTSDAVDFLMGQKNGANYVVLYQMLCLKTVNTSGKLEREIGEVIIPYNAEKIQRDLKYFDIDTVMIALELFKKLGLIYKDKNGTLQIANFENMIGSESKWAQYKRDKKEIGISGQPKVLSHELEMHWKNSKLIPIKLQTDKDKDKETTMKINTTRARASIKSQENIDDEKPPFQIPSKLLVAQYWLDHTEHNSDWVKFYGFYQRRKWTASDGTQIRDWRALMEECERESAGVIERKLIDKIDNQGGDYDVEVENVKRQEEFRVEFTKQEIERLKGEQK